MRHVRALYTRYSHWGRYSGVTQLVRYLDPTRYRVHLDGASDSDADLPLPHAGLRQRLRARVQHRMAWYKLSDLAAELRALPGCLMNRTDVVHFLDAEHSAQYLPQWLRRSGVSRTRTVATFHQPPELLAQLTDRTLVERLDCVTTVSPPQAEYFAQFLPASRIRVTLHGIDTDFFRPDGNGRESTPPRFRCITVGHWLRDWATLHRVAQLLASCRDIEFAIVTDRETGLEGLANVVRHRNVDDTTLLALYRQSDVLLLPVTQATANNALLEGIATGLPVVTSDIPAMRAYLRGDEGILVKDNVPGDIADALLHLMRHPDARRAMGRQARTRAEQLSWRNVVPQWETVYDAVTGRTDE